MGKINGILNGKMYEDVEKPEENSNRNMGKIDGILWENGEIYGILVGKYGKTIGSHGNMCNIYGIPWENLWNSMGKWGKTHAIQR